MLKADRFFFGNTNMGKIYERLLFTIIDRPGLVRSSKSKPVGRQLYLDAWIVFAEFGQVNNNKQLTLYVANFFHLGF